MKHLNEYITEQYDEDINEGFIGNLLKKLWNYLFNGEKDRVEQNNGVYKFNSDFFDKNTISLKDVKGGIIEEKKFKDLKKDIFPKVEDKNCYINKYEAQHNEFIKNLYSDNNIDNKIKSNIKRFVFNIKDNIIGFASYYTTKLSDSDNNLFTNIFAFSIEPKLNDDIDMDEIVKQMLKLMGIKNSKVGFSINLNDFSGGTLSSIVNSYKLQEAKLYHDDKKYNNATMYTNIKKLVAQKNNKKNENLNEELDVDNIFWKLEKWFERNQDEEKEFIELVINAKQNKFTNIQDLEKYMKTTVMYTHLKEFINFIFDDFDLESNKDYIYKLQTILNYVKSNREINNKYNK